MSESGPTQNSDADNVSQEKWPALFGDGQMVYAADQEPSERVTKTLVNYKSKYRSRPVDFSVEKSDREQIIDTLEGPVACRVGDLIVTGLAGERWPVPESKFAEKYQSAHGLNQASNGRYTKRVRDVEAAQLYETLKIQLSKGRGELNGKPGDWCVWYSENDFAIVASNIFLKLYEPKTISVYVELGKDLSDAHKQSALSLIQSLNKVLRNTSIVFSEEAANTSHPVWFRILKQLSHDHRIVPEIIDISVESVVDQGQTSLLALVEAELLKNSAWTLTKRAILKMLGRNFKDQQEESLESVVAKQLVAVERFNANLEGSTKPIDSSFFIENRDESTEPQGIRKVCALGAVADHFATIYQTKWQELVFKTTKKIASQSIFKWFGSIRLSLVPLGLLAALMLTAFSELSGTCDVDDPLGFELCASSTWEQWAGPFFFFVYLSALSSAWIRYIKAKAEKWETCHQDYRLLAESIRVLHVRSVLAKPSCVAADLPLAEPADSGWVRLALRSIFFDAHQTGLQTNVDVATGVGQAIKTFVIPQIQYHENSLLVRREQAIERLSIAASRWLIFFFFILATLTANVIAEIFHHPFLSPMMHHAVMICMVLGLVSWGSMRKVMDSFGLEQELQRGRLVLSKLVQAQSTCTDESILNAAQFFLDDQAHWHALHRSKPVEAATGG